MKLYFSARVAATGVILIAGMLRASYWQWERHIEKQGYIARMQERLAVPPVPVAAVLNSAPDELFYRRVIVAGEYDFSHEMVLRNRRLDDEAGVHVITPLKIAGSERTVLVDRGFLPLQYAADRSQFQRSPHASFIGLVKESSGRRFLAPADPPSGGGNPWVDAWLRVDLPGMARQMEGPIEPFYLEIMSTADPAEAQEKIVTSTAGREELLVMGMTQLGEHTKTARRLDEYPVPVFDTVIPPGRHFGYVFEWATMALVTFLICVVIQLRPRRQPLVAETD